MRKWGELSSEEILLFIAKLRLKGTHNNEHAIIRVSLVYGKSDLTDAITRFSKKEELHGAELVEIAKSIYEEAKKIADTLTILV